MAVDLRVVFLFLLFLTIILYIFRFGPVVTGSDLKNMILDVLLVPAALGTVAVFGFLLTRTDPIPLIREAAYQLSLQQLVAFEEAIPSQTPNLVNTINVEKIFKSDTDGDEQEEWVVFFKFDLQNGKSPVKAAVYDGDRGNPPVIFPYSLTVPDRDYLTEQAQSVNFELVDVTNDSNGPNETNLPELQIFDGNELAFFRFNQNSEPWDFPRDAPPRYRPIGFFTGTGGVRFNSTTKEVTVIDRRDRDRSQLAVRSIYQLNQATNTYWDSFDSTQLAAPVVSTVDFFEGPPQDIINTAYPEKIVLGFYASTCAVRDDTLCNLANNNWITESFLAGDALSEYLAGNADYFGLPNFDVSSISVTYLRYFPSLETDPDLLPTGQGRDVVTGEQPELNVVDVTISVGGVVETLRYEMRTIEGEWKIVGRLPLETANSSPSSPPEANNDRASTQPGTSITINVLANDTDPDGDLDPDSLQVMTAAEISAAAIVPDRTGNITYTPPADSSVTEDRFEYQVCDSLGNCATAEVIVAIETAPPEPTEQPTEPSCEPPWPPNSPCAPRW